MICENCGSKMLELPRKSKRHVQRYRCPCCELYNAAVAASHEAASELARQRSPSAKVVNGAWLNEHGIFARVDGIVVQVGSGKEAAPFVALTTAALNAGRL